MDSRCIDKGNPLSEEQVEQFKKATEPAVEWLNRNGNPHQKIIIEMGSVELVSGEVGFTTEVPD